MFSQLYNNSISFPYFFLSYDTCSINVNPLFHAAIKNHHKILSAFSYFFLSFIFQQHLARESQHTQQYKKIRIFLYFTLWNFQNNAK